MSGRLIKGPIIRIFFKNTYFDDLASQEREVAQGIIQCFTVIEIVETDCDPDPPRIRLVFQEETRHLCKILFCLQDFIQFLYVIWPAVGGIVQ